MLRKRKQKKHTLKEHKWDTWEGDDGRIGLSRARVGHIARWKTGGGGMFRVEHLKRRRCRRACVRQHVGGHVFG